MSEDMNIKAFTAIEKAFKPAIEKAHKYHRIGLFGAGDLGLILLKLCRDNGIKVHAFFDDYYTAEELHGVPVYKLSETTLKEQQCDALFLSTITSVERMKDQLKSIHFSGQVLEMTDAHSYLRSHNYRTSPSELIEQFKDKHKGQRAFIIGNGPSLLDTDPLLLKDEITFACNNIYYMEGFEPTYYVAEDKVLTQDRAKEINALPWTKFFPSILSNWITNGIFLKARGSKWPEFFSTDLCQWLEINFTVTYSMLQVAYYMGIEEVYLIGIDHNYKLDNEQHTRDGVVLTSIKDDPNHFHPDYFGKGYRWHDPRVDRMEASYEIAKKFYEADGRKIYNATAGGKLEVFERADFTSLINKEK